MYSIMLEAYRKLPFLCIQKKNPAEARLFLKDLFGFLKENVFSEEF